MRTAPRGTQQTGGGSKKSYSREDAIEIFNGLLAEDKVDVGPDFYDEELFRDDPEYLSDTFEVLEEKNLDIITKVGENEQALDKFKTEYEEMQRYYKNKIGGLENEKTKYTQ